MSHEPSTHSRYRYALELRDARAERRGERLHFFGRTAARVQRGAELMVGDATEVAAQPRDVLHGDRPPRVGRALARVAELHEPVRHAGDELRRLRRERLRI